MINHVGVIPFVADHDISSALSIQKIISGISRQSIITTIAITIDIFISSENQILKVVG